MVRSVGSKGVGAWSAVVAMLGLIAAATLVSLSDGTHGGGTPFWCMACGDYGLADGLANVALFVPLGWALFRTGLSPAPTIGLIIVTTMAIEGLQVGTVSGRVASASDIVANAVGGVAGMALARVPRWAASSRGHAARAAAVYGLVAAATLGGTIALQAIALPASLRWTRESPRLPDYTDFTGTVHAVRLGGLPPAARPPRAVAVGVDLISGNPDRRRAEIVSTWPPDGSAWMWLDQQGRDLRGHVASASDRLRLRGHSPWLADVMPAAAGSTVSVTFAAQRFSYNLTVRGAEASVAQAVRISPADGWRLLVPFERGRERWAPLLGALWLGALLAPLGYLAAVRSAGAAAGAGAGAAAYLAVVPLVLGCAALPLAGWGGAVAGMVAGMGAARWTT